MDSSLSFCTTCRKVPPREGLKTCSACAERAQKHRRRNREQGLCHCGNIPLPKRRSCSVCLAAHRLLRKRRLDEGLCGTCYRLPVEPGYTSCSECRARHTKQILRYKATGCCPCSKPATPGKKSCEACRTRLALAYKQTKQQVMDAYGSVCVCCGESDLAFLELDHIHNNGAEHRRRTGHMGHTFYVKLRQANYPAGYQVLCTTCNKAKGHLNSECPHQTKQRAMLLALSDLPLTY